MGETGSGSKNCQASLGGCLDCFFTYVSASERYCSRSDFLTDTTVVLYDKCVIKTKGEISILWQKLKVSPWITPAVKAPYVRLITTEHGAKGDVISNYDLRLVQPNTAAIDTAGLHTIEHLLASLLRDRMDGVIDCSPFGCRTGFHLITWGEHSTTEVAKALKSSLEAIANDITWDDVPGVDIKSCGNYKDHSLFSAKEWAKLILSRGISNDPYTRQVV